MGSMLAGHPDVDKVAFTGSTEVRRPLMLWFLLLCSRKGWCGGAIGKASDCDSQVVGLSHSWSPFCSGLGQATCTCVPLSPSSIICYRLRGVISLAAKVTPGLVETNSSLPPVLWLSHFGLTAKRPGSHDIKYLECREGYNVGLSGGHIGNHQWASNWPLILHDLELSWFKVIKITCEIFQKSLQIRHCLLEVAVYSCLDNGVGNSMHWADTHSLECTSCC